MTPSQPPTVQGFRRLAESCLGGVAIAALTALPSAVRATREAPFLCVLLVAWSCLLPIATFGMWGTRLASRGLRGVLGASPPSVAALRLTLWVALATPWFSVTAKWLKDNTHHRGLAAVTYAIVVFGVALLSAVGAIRLVDYGRGLAERGFSKWLLAFAFVLLLIPTAQMGVPLARPLQDQGEFIRLAALDGAFVVAALAIFASVDFGSVVCRFGQRWGLAFAAGVLISGALALSSERGTAAALRHRGGLSAVVLSLSGLGDAPPSQGVPWEPAPQ